VNAHNAGLDENPNLQSIKQLSRNMCLMSLSEFVGKEMLQTGCMINKSTRKCGFVFV